MSEALSVIEKRDIVNRRGWRKGPWDGEADFREWTTSNGHLARIIRVSGTGALCGYVGIPKGHPDFGKGEYADFDDYEVHGGVTFCAKLKDDRGLWWIGFDASHAGDQYPGSGGNAFLAMTPLTDMVLGIEVPPGYKGFDYMTAQVEKLSEQAKRRSNP